jgi:putative hydrolase of the HAD superfamily
MAARRERRSASLATESRQLRYALFDLDNTLYPRGSGVMEAVSRRICAYMAMRLGMDEVTINELRPRYWKQYGTTMRGLLVEYNVDPDEYLWYVHDFAMTDYVTANGELDQALAEVPWYKAVFTNASRRHAEQVLAALGIRPQFRTIIDIKDTGYIGKPDVRAYQHVLDALGAEAAECVIIEDSTVNLRPAKALGMTTVLVGLAESPREAPASVAGTFGEEVADSVDFAISRIEDIGRIAQRLKVGKHGP